MTEKELKELIAVFPECLENERQLRALLTDLYPDCKKGLLNALVACQRVGALAEMQRSASITALQFDRWRKALYEEYGLSDQICTEALQLWAKGMNRPIPQITVSKPAAQCEEPKPKPPVKPAASLADFEIENGCIVKYVGAGGDVVIPEGIVGIKNCAAFEYQSPLSLTLPRSLTQIDPGAFKYCPHLEHLVVAEGNPKYHSKEDCVIETATRTLIAACPGVKFKITPTVTQIACGAFNFCGESASLSIPTNIEIIHPGALFYCTALESIKVSPLNKRYYSTGDCIIERETNTLIAGCKNSVIPPAVTRIEQNAFHGCVSLSAITLPTGLCSIGSYAFWNCNGLTKLDVPHHVSCIEEYAFACANGLSTVYLRNSAAQIASSAFYGCKALKDIYYAGTIEEWQRHQITLPDTCTIHCATVSAPSPTPVNRSPQKPSTPQPSKKEEKKNPKLSVGSYIGFGFFSLLTVLSFILNFVALSSDDQTATLIFAIACLFINIPTFLSLLGFGMSDRFPEILGLSTFILLIITCIMNIIGFAIKC